MQIITLLAAILCFIVGISVSIANPSRPSNRAFTTFSLILTAWLACVVGAMISGSARENGLGGDLELWFRANGIFASFSPWGIWLLINSIIYKKNEGFRAFRNSAPILGIGILLAILCLSDSFVIDGESMFLRRGTGYFVHTGAMVILYLTTFVKIHKHLRNQSGIRRLELHFLALIAGVVALSLALLNGLGNLLETRAFNRTSIFVVFAAYLFMAWALAHHRIFNARHVLLSVGQRMAVIGLLAIASWGVAGLLTPVMTEASAWLISIFICGTNVFWLDHQTRNWLGLGNEKILAGVRGSVLAASQSEVGAVRLIAEFERLLAAHHLSGPAYILSKQGEKYVGKDFAFSAQRSGFHTLQAWGWITPESLQRRRTNPGLADLGAFLDERGLGVMVTTPTGSPSPTMLVAVSTKKNEWPFTYPEVQRLQNVAELMDSILTRSRLTDQRVMRARMEYLAMMSRGLAHDLKNLITPVSTFLVHTEGHFLPKTSESDVHAAARRSVQAMTEYLREALFFSDQLAPKFEAVRILDVYEGVRLAIATKAAHRGVALMFHEEFPLTLKADRILLQRLISNLVSNALDACSTGQKIEVTASLCRPGWVGLMVADTGCGMTPAVVERIFDPYFTTKQFGQDVRGVGLGLTISQKIVDLHGGTIAVASTVGRGTIMNVELPLVPPQSGPLSSTGI